MSKSIFKDEWKGKLRYAEYFTKNMLNCQLQEDFRMDTLKTEIELS
jgi:hypothetical protein